LAILIVGGGITGLAAAYELAARGVEFLLLEASDRLGGLIRTEKADGFTIEAGPDSVLAQKPAALQLCDELGLGPRLITSKVPRDAFVLSRGKLHPLPSPSILGLPLTWRGILQYDLLSPLARLRMAAEPLVRRSRNAEEDESVASFFARRFGRATVPLIAAPLLGGIHAGRVDALSIRSVFPKLSEAERTRGSVLRAFRRMGTRPSPQGAFRSLSSGMSELVTAIGRRLPPGSVRLSSGAATLRKTEDGWSVGTAQGDVRARAVILAAPAFAAARLLAGIDADASALCAATTYASSASIALAYRREQVAHPLAGSGFVVARTDESSRVTACTWVSSKWEGRAPEGCVLLRAFAGGASDPQAVDLSDEGLTETAIRELTPVLGLTGAPVLARVYRWRDAGAQHNVGQIARVAQLEERLARHPGLLVAGSGFRSLGIPDCIADGRAAAAAAERAAV
jgi:oxygen-dependent protoporphyrinogen oxidase